eukprot:COSAG02_NODE_3093_length_7383_cov_2.908018_3_plen_47_part_00
MDLAVLFYRRNCSCAIVGINSDVKIARHSQASSLLDTRILAFKMQG